jgi:hypothetical protein
MSGVSSGIIAKGGGDGVLWSINAQTTIDPLHDTTKKKKCSAIFIENPKKSNHQNANFDRQKFQRQFFFQNSRQE